MFKTLKKQIKELKKQQASNEKESNEFKIQQYEKELERIKKMFPEDFFDE